MSHNTPKPAPVQAPPPAPPPPPPKPEADPMDELLRKRKQQRQATPGETSYASTILSQGAGGGQKLGG